MSKVVACLIVQSSSLFQLLGDTSVVQRSLTRFKSVRGVDKIICVTSDRLKERTAVVCKNLDIPLHVVPQTVKETAVENWLISATGPLAGAMIGLFDYGISPLIGAPKVEACLRAVLTNKHSVCVPVRTVDVLVPNESKCVKIQHVIPGIKAFSINKSKDKSKVGTVKISLIESLSTVNADEALLMAAAVDFNYV